jgi:hypothetical protein
VSSTSKKRPRTPPLPRTKKKSPPGAARAPAIASRSAAKPRPPAIVPDPGGYAVFDAASLTGTGRPVEVGRIVRGADGLEAWNRVEGGYRRIGRFKASEPAIMALKGPARTRRPAAAESGSARGARVIPLPARRKRR